jgi:hypothetical protein
MDRYARKHVHLTRLTRIALAAAMLLTLVVGAVAGVGSAQPAYAAPGALIELPGTFEAEDYKLGGPGVGYYDTTSGNSGKAYRSDDVDVQACQDPFSGETCYNVGWIKQGEWLAYDVNVAATGTFVFDTRVATSNSGRSFSFSLNGADLTGPIAVPNTGGMQTWATVSSPEVQLSAGRYELRMLFDGTSFNVNAVTVRQVSGAAAAPSAPAEPAPAEPAPPAPAETTPTPAPQPSSTPEPQPEANMTVPQVLQQIASAGRNRFNVTSPSNGSTSTPTPTPAPASPTPTPAPSTPEPQPQPQPATGRTFWVATNGNDGADGSQNAPWRSLSASMKKLKAGDTLLVRGGEYRERVEVRGESVPRGRSDARITVKAAPGENPVVRGFFWVSNTDYWTFDNIDVTWDTANTDPKQHMVRLWKGTGWVWENSELYGARGYSAILVDGGGTGWVIRNNYIHDTARSNALSQDHLIYVSAGSDGIVERNLLVNAPNGRGVKIGTPSAGEGLPRNVIVRYNTIVNSGSGNIGVSNDAHSNQIYGNILVTATNGYHSVHDWNATGRNNVVRDNVVFDSKGAIKPGSPLVDGGGNRVLNPMLDGQYRPTNAALYDAQGVLQYGHLAGTTR